jgi:hypothetical protein
MVADLPWKAYTRRNLKKLMFFIKHMASLPYSQEYYAALLS